MRVHVLLCQVVMLALSLSVSPCAQGYDGGGAAQASRQAVVKDDGNNVRAAGGPRYMESRIIGVLNKGDRVAVHRQDGKWTEITIPDGTRGWVHSACLAPASSGGTTSDSGSMTCPPELPRRFSVDIDGDGRKELIKLEDIPNAQGGDGRLAVYDAQGQLLWRGPLGEDPLSFFCRDWGLYWPSLIGDVDGDGFAELIARQPQSDVSPSSFLLARWTPNGFKTVHRGWSLLEQPAGSGRFVATSPAADGQPVIWIMEFLSLQVDGEMRVSIYRAVGGEVRTGTALVSLSMEGARLKRWLEPLH